MTIFSWPLVVGCSRKRTHRPRNELAKRVWPALERVHRPAALSRWTRTFVPYAKAAFLCERPESVRRPSQSEGSMRRSVPKRLFYTVAMPAAFGVNLGLG